MSMRNLLAVLGISATVLGIGYSVRQQSAPASRQLVTGKFISPIGEQTEVGSFPINMAVSPDGKFIVVTNIGFREQLSVLDGTTGALVSRREFVARGTKNRNLYYGLAFSKQSDRTLLYASQGTEDQVGVFELTDQGVLTELPKLQNPAPATYGSPHCVSGLAVSSDGKLIYAVNNQSTVKNGFNSSISILDASGVRPAKEFVVPGFPYAVCAVTKGKKADSHLFISGEREGIVIDLNVVDGSSRQIKVGNGCTGLLLDNSQTHLYVSNSQSDTVSIIDTDRDRVTDTILLRQGDLRGLPGATPLGAALSPDEKSLYVAMADMNAVAVVDLHSKRLSGYLPAGWYPTSVAVSQNGQKLFVANGKGVQAKNPNDVPVRNWGQYGPNILEGTVSVLNLPEAVNHLADSTQSVLANNLSLGKVAAIRSAEFKHPKINHVIYVIRENRTFDQVLGDMPGVDADSKICMFPKEVTPNLHALASRFAVMDNFYVCAEVSMDGWVWSTAGIANPYVERNTFYNYSGRGRSYDTEGTNNDSPVDLLGLRDMATPPNGYLWDGAAAHHLSYRNYGFYVSTDAASRKASNEPLEGEEAPTKKALIGHTCADFPEFDLSYPDSEAYQKLRIGWPEQKKSFGRKHDHSRMQTFRREFNEYVANGDLPNLVMIRLPRDHTDGTTPRQSSPRACVADNDYAIGQLVDMVSHSPYWKDTAICILEDDAQAGFDHVDSHRSPALVISAYVQPHKVDNRFYNTDSMLHTIELLLGTRPMCQYDAIAAPIDVFTKGAENDKPYEAILPRIEIIGEVNKPRGYRSEDSARLLDLHAENSAADIELNDILWGAIKGPRSPRPATRGALWHAADLDN